MEVQGGSRQTPRSFRSLRDYGPGGSETHASRSERPRRCIHSFNRKAVHSVTVCSPVEKAQSRVSRLRPDPEVGKSFQGILGPKPSCIATRRKAKFLLIGRFQPFVALYGRASPTIPRNDLLRACSCS